MWAGVYRGLVVSTADPLGAARVRLVVAQVSGAVPTDWVPPALTGAGTPAVGDVVFVAYQAGDASYPVYLPPVPAPYQPPADPAWQVQASPVLGGLTLGNGTVTSRYLVTGYVVRWALTIVWGSTTTSSPTAAITVSTPVTQDPGSGMRWTGMVLINPGGGNAFRPGGSWLLPGNTSVSIEAQRTSDLAFVPFSTAGLSIASGGWLTMQMTYDKA